ncbi:MAG: hypothetical protein DID89_2727547416 [Candidatus Nitrotoga sp. CP45]|nr:MAG: hypothetical protein DID89_2727547416 [Candidatus Nitrotoga sp. CP45]
MEAPTISKGHLKFLIPPSSFLYGDVWGGLKIKSDIAVYDSKNRGLREGQPEEKHNYGLEEVERRCHPYRKY